MIRRMLFATLFLSALNVTAQHCPWDCSGMILLQTDVTPTEFKNLAPVLVNGEKEIIVDTIYGTGLDTKDTCLFMHYDDFVKNRTEKISIHHWYRYDTLYRFAEGHYMVKYNYCRYKYAGNSALFLRFNNPSNGEYRYIEIPPGRRIHLHDFNQEISKRLPLSQIEKMQHLVMEVNRHDWGLPDK